MVRIASIFTLLMALSAPACADDVAYPPGSRIGIVPPAGLHASASFPGFEDRDRNVAILLTVLPPQAYAEFEKADSNEAMRRQGAKLEKREVLVLPGGKALLVIGSQELEPSKDPSRPAPKADAKPGASAILPKTRTWLLVASTRDLTALVTVMIPDAAKDAYPDNAIRAALASLAVRAEVPVEEQLGLLPFKVGELAGFKIGAVLPGRALMLTDAANNAAAGSVERTIEPRITVTLIPGAPSDLGSRDDLARQMFASIPNLKDARIIQSESLRIGGQPGHELRATARAADAGLELTLVQWLRFGSGASLHLVGMASSEAWMQAYPRFRAVRDGIEPR
jgi:hypothetical protein